MFILFNENPQTFSENPDSQINKTNFARRNSKMFQINSNMQPSFIENSETYLYYSS